MANSFLRTAPRGLHASACARYLRDSERIDVQELITTALDTLCPMVIADRTDRTVRVDGRLTRLTRTQFCLLTQLSETAGEWIKTSELIGRLRATHHLPDSSLVRVHVHALRRRLRARARWLQSDPARVRGYRWVGPKL